MTATFSPVVVLQATPNIYVVDYLFTLVGEAGAGSDPDMDLITVDLLLPKLGTNQISNTVYLNFLF